MEVTLEADCKETQQAKKGDKVTVHYGGFLQDGKSLKLAVQLTFCPANSLATLFLKLTAVTLLKPDEDCIMC